MPRKPHTYNYIYKTTCNVTGRYYIGMHSTSILEDGYLGSGKRLRYSVKKYGKDNHSKEILEFLPNRIALELRESSIVNGNLLLDQLCMNLTKGGTGGGGFRNDEHKLKFLKAGTIASTKSGKSKETLKKLLANEEWSTDYKKKISDSLTGLKRKTPVRNKHSEETKQKMRKPKSKKREAMSAEQKLAISNSLKLRNSLNKNCYSVQ